MVTLLRLSSRQLDDSSTGHFSEVLDPTTTKYSPQKDWITIQCVCVCVLCVGVCVCSRLCVHVCESKRWVRGSRGQA